ncbi:MAG: sigma-54 dependent transcriptional regulator [Chromatiales bacterium]|jgi:two-component system response regulator FlrC
MSAQTILIVEDDKSLGQALADTLELAGMQSIHVTDGKAALELLAQQEVDVVVSDVQMEPMDGFTLLEQLRNRYNTIPAILMTAFATVEKAVSAMRLGAVDYLVKPFEAESLIEKISRYLPQETPRVNSLVADDLRTRDLVQMALRVAATDASVMIGGESGSGKEVFARFIHHNSTRCEGPFIAINCAAIPDNMLEAVLFGYEKGAFTGAYKSSAGKFELAQGGTLLLDEISEMSLPLQAKLLRVLQEREVERLGSSKTIELDVRVLATSNRKLREEVAAGRFREDLFYRLNVFPLTLPPLRERSRDILPLTQYLIQRHLRGGEAIPQLSHAAEQKMLTYAWPGNVRELDNVVQRALILKNGDVIDVDDLCFENEDVPLQAVAANHAVVMPVDSNPLADEQADAGNGGNLSSDLKSVEERMIIDALNSGNGSRKIAAEILGISPRTLRYKIARLRDAGIAIPR